MLGGVPVKMASVRKNAVLFIGLNPDCLAEVRELQKHCQVILIGNSKHADEIMIGGHKHDLATPSGRKAALAKILLSGPPMVGSPVSARVATLASCVQKALRVCDSDSRCIAPTAS